jgi:sugar phosphate isomerase/epimerase
MLEFSCADFTFPLLTVEQTLGLLRLLEIRAVDIGLFARSSHFRPQDLMPEARDYASRVAEKLSGYEIAAADVFLQIGTEPALSSANDPDPDIRADNRKLFELAVAFTTLIGCAHMTGLPGVAHPGQDPRQSFELAVEEADWRLRAASAAGLRYSIEPHLGSICPDVHSTLRMLKSVPGLTLTLDYGHFIAAGIANEEVHQLVPYASHIHVRSGAPGKLQTTTSENTIDFAGLVLRLVSCEYRGHICLEYVWTEWQRCNRTDNLSETILLRRLLVNSFEAIDAKCV